MIMSQQGSSIISGESTEVKYKKALVQIQKIHNANKVLKNQCEEMKSDFQRQIHDLSESYDHVSKQCQILKNDKAELEKFLEELQVSNSQLRKEYNNLQREVSYLNDVLTEQNTELKKVNAFKDQKGLSALITSYQDREINYRKDLVRQDELIKNLKVSCETLENELAEERRQRFKLQDLNGNLKMEISRYRELNANLLHKNQSIVASLLNRTNQSKEKYREAENVLGELGRQLEIVKAARLDQQSTNRATVTLQSYESILQQKSKLQNEILRLRQRVSEGERKAGELLQVQEKMKRAILRSEQLQQQCNMLKSKLIIIETKQLMEGINEEGSLQQFQQQVMVNMAQNDPLSAIKNSASSAHFQLMKTYISDLSAKLTKTVSEKKDLEKRYRSLKDKFSERAEKAIGWEEQNKLLRGKVEGFERLTERLQFELQSVLEGHEQEMNKMKAITNSILTKKSEENKVANAFIRAQLDLQLDKFDKTQKGLRQQIETLKLQKSTQKIKNTDLQDQLQQASEFLAIYKTKFAQISEQNAQTEEASQLLADTAARYEQLYREERAKNEALLTQKQTLTSKLAQQLEELTKKGHEQQDSKTKQTNTEGELRKTRTELQQVKAELDIVQSKLQGAITEQSEKEKVSGSGIRSESDYYLNLQENLKQQRQNNRQLEAEVQTLRLRLDRSVVQSQRVSSLEDALNVKSDQLNDLRRKTITLEKQVGVLEAENKEERSEKETLRKENSALKTKLLQSGQQVRKSYEIRDLQNKKNAQKLTEDIATLTSQLRDERRAAARLQVELQTHKAEVQRLEEFVEQNKRKELSIYEELGTLRTTYESTCEEGERLKSQLRFQKGVQEGLNNEVAGAQERIYKLNQENSEIRLKMQSLDNDISELRRELSGLKIYLSEVEEYANAKISSPNWQEQRDRDNLNNFVQRVKKILRTSELSNAGQTRFIFSPAPTPALPDFLRTYDSNYSQPYEPPKPVTLNDSPFTRNYGGEATFKYGDYN